LVFLQPPLIWVQMYSSTPRPQILESFRPLELNFHRYGIQKSRPRKGILELISGTCQSSCVPRISQGFWNCLLPFGSETMWRHLL